MGYLSNANYNAILLCVIVSVGGLLFGFDTGLISGITEMRAFVASYSGSKTFETGVAGPDDHLESWIYSLMIGIPSLGMASGAFGSGIAGDKFGRKISIIYASIIFSIGVLLQLVTVTSLSIFLIGRLIAGVGIGLLSGLVPVYQAECAPKKIRGALISTYQLAITIGIELSNVVNYLTTDIPNDSSFRIPIGLQFVLVALLLFGIIFVPESPRYLYSIGKEHQATKALLYVHNSDTMTKEMQDEVTEICRDVEKEKNEKAISYTTLLKHPHRKRTAIAAAAQLFQQFTGINFIFYFGVSFFKNVGFSNPYYGTLTAGAVNVLSTVPAIYLVDTLGRRALLMGGAAAMFISQFVVGVLGFIDVQGENYPIPILVFSCIFVASFAVSWGTGAWIVCSEVFSQNTRSKGNSIAVATNWVSNAAIGFFTAPLVNKDGANLGARVGLFWAAFIFLSIIYVYFFVPETRGISLVTIDRLFSEKIPARNVSAWLNSAPPTDNQMGETPLKSSGDAYEGYSGSNDANLSDKANNITDPITEAGKI